MIALPLAPWPDASTAAGAAFFANAEDYLKGWLTLNYPLPFALGVVANAEGEASMDPNALGDWVDASGVRIPYGKPHPPGSSPLSVGLHERKEARTKQIRDGFYYNAKLVANGLGTDLRALALAGKNTIAIELVCTDWELKTFPSYGLAAMRELKSAAEAGAMFCARFEQTADPAQAERRGRMAERWAVHFAKAGF